MGPGDDRQRCLRACREALRVRYLPVGAGGADLALTAAAPLTVATGDRFAVTFTINNIGSEPANDGRLHVTLPTNATFTGDGLLYSSELAPGLPREFFRFLIVP